MILRLLAALQDRYLAFRWRRDRAALPRIAHADEATRAYLNAARYRKRRRYVLVGVLVWDGHKEAVVNRRIEVTYSTMGQSSPASVGERKDYRWNGDPDKSLAANSERAATPQQRSVYREERLVVFTAARARGLKVGAAGLEAGVTSKTAQGYERDRKARAREARDA